MVDEYWRFYGQIRFAYHYHEIIRNRLIRFMKWISVASYVITAVSLAGWASTGKAAAIWSIIIFASQVANGLIKDQLGWNEEKLMLSAYLSDMNEIILNFEKGWRQIILGQLTEEKIMQRINSVDEQYKELERRYILPYDLDESVSAIKKADIRTNAELKSLHGEGDDRHDQQLGAGSPCPEAKP